MSPTDLKSQIALGEDSRHQFKQEELRRLFQSVDQFHADELPTKAGIDKLDKLRFRSTDYLDTEDFSGPFRKLFDDTLAFIMRNLHKVQAGQGVNSPGIAEIPASVFEELLVNALVHRDYLVSATIRLFIFDDRIEIISPGHLPNNLTVEKIRAGISNIRNPILASYVAKGMLPYKGLGSGIKRALQDWPDIDFTDDRERCLFIATVRRKSIGGSK